MSQNDQLQMKTVAPVFIEACKNPSTQRSTNNLINSKNMIIVMKRNADEKHIEHVIEHIKKISLKPVPLHGTERTVVAVLGDERDVDQMRISAMPGVDKVMAVLNPYKLSGRETKKENTIIDLGDGVTIGGNELSIMAGPCGIESAAQTEAAARAVKASGAKILRGGAFKPRTSPYSFEGLGEEGLKIMHETAKRHNLKTITEIVDIRDVEVIDKRVDMFQIGARNMQNFNLLKEVGSTNKPILLKRGMSATIKELLLAAEHIMSKGNPNVALCERGIRTFETETRNTLALATVPLVKELSHLPIIVDPSHATGKPSLIGPMSKAAIAAGADGIIVEVHPNPEEALSDADQALTPAMFDSIMHELKPIADAVGRAL